MKHLLLAVFFWGIWVGAKGQKYDYVWLSGYDSHVGFDTSWGFYFGTSVLDFNYTPCDIRHDSLEMNFGRTNTSFCDSNGNLLFYTNGIYVANSLNEKVTNSDSLNIGNPPYWADPYVPLYGYRFAYAIYAIPNLTNPNQYYLLHDLVEKKVISGAVKVFGTGFLITLLDMSLNGGHGEVVYKNQVIVDDTLADNFGVTRHGNGKDWWVLVQERETNCYYRILIDETGVHKMPDLTCTGTSFSLDDFGPHTFSPDGNKFICVSYYTGLHIYDFDRCTGTLSNPLYLPLPIIDSAGWLGMGITVSPNNRFLYVSLTRHLYQFDLWATDVLESIDTVGIFDNTNAPFPAVFHTAQNGPDGKIYISCGNADTVYHVIERPDEKGDSCLFKQHSLSLPSPSAGVPSFPNYRLGVLSGSPCDTLTGLNETARSEKEKVIKVFPNPATDYVMVDYGFTDWSKGDAALEITNGLGQLVHKQMLPRYSGFQKVDVSAFACGLYMVCIKRGTGVVAAAKFARE